MRTLLQFIIVIMGGLLVLSGCASPASERISPPTATSDQMPQAGNETPDPQFSTTGNFLFYDSFATW